MLPTVTDFLRPKPDRPRGRQAPAWCGLAAILLLCLGACAGGVDPQPMSSVEVPSAFTTKVAGTWALVIADRSLDTQIEPPDLACGGNTFPVDMEARLRRFMVQSFSQVADQVVLAEHEMAASDLKSQGYTGQIVVASTALTPNVTFRRTGLSALVDSDMELGATIEVSGHAGVLYRHAFSLTGISHADAGIICQKGSAAIARAADSAMQQLSIASASAFADSPEIRLPPHARY